MRLVSAAAVLPATSVSNDDVLELLRRHSKAGFRGDLDRAVERVRRGLTRSGAVSRHWLDGDEAALDLVARAFEEALLRSGCDREEIDLLIFAGMDRGFIEPANAYFVAAALGLDRAECFDISDACNGFSRAVHVASGLFGTGEYKKAVVINAEFAMMPGGAIYPTLYTLAEEGDLEWAFPAYTLGEAVTAVVLAAEGDPWTFRFTSRPDLADLCTVPLPGYQRWVGAGSRAGIAGMLRFSSFGGEMERIARLEIGKLCDDLVVTSDNTSAIFVHAASARPWKEAAAERGWGDILHNPYRDFGNVGSASIPLGIALAMIEGGVRRGDPVAACVGSAGMVFSVYRWVL